MQFKKYALAAAAAIIASNAQAGDVEINSFLTIGASAISEEGAYLDQVTENISYENDTHYGMNFRTQISDRVSSAAQLLATATDSNFNVDAEWAFISYQFSPNTSLRAGKLNLITFLLSDYATVGYLHPWVRPPVEVYRNNPMKNYLGLELMHQTRFSSTTKLTSQFFTGSTHVEDGYVRMEASNGFGMNFQLDMPGTTLRIGAISPTIQVKMFNPMTNSTSEVLDQEDRAVMYTVGASVEAGDFIMYTEGMATNTKGQTQGIFPNQKGAYITFGYTFGNFLPHLTFGTSSGEDYTGPTNLIDPMCGGTPGCAVRAPVTQDSITLGLKYTVDETIAIKFEVQQLSFDITNGKGQGFAALNDPTLDSLTNVSIALDAIF